MTTYNAWLKRQKLNATELKHYAQIIDTEIAYYKICIANYSPEDLKEYGVPYLKKLQDQRADLLNALDAKTKDIMKSPM